jgi:N-acetylneuraminic acid mutarotase
MLLWGGGPGRFEGTGGAYDPDTDEWSVLNTIRAPSPRAGHTAILAGNQWIIWGGYSGFGIDDFLASGGILYW